MQTRLIIAGVSVASAGIGALFSWAITADYFERKANQEFEDESAQIFDVRVITVDDSVVAPQSEADSEISDLAQGFIPPEEPELDTVQDDQTSQTAEEINQEEASEPDPEDWGEIPQADPEETRTNLQKLIDQYTKDPEAIQEFTQFAGHSIEPDYTPPFIISQAKYAWDDEEGDNYSKIALTYYSSSRVVLDEDEEQVDDVNSLVGWRNLKSFGHESGDPNIIYIRNRRLMTDFEVEQVDDILPIHIRYGMSRDEFQANKAAGFIKFRPGDD